MRELILAQEPEAYIGSLKELAARLGVGIVTVQQAARILEHEGLLAVRRGPGGGYYGLRPDEAALARSLAAYLNVHGFGLRESLEMIVLLDCEMMPAAARCNDPSLRESLKEVASQIASSETLDQRVSLEVAFRDVLFRMVNRPLTELVYRITSAPFRAQPNSSLNLGRDSIEMWRNGRLRMINAILCQDTELARFEAERFRTEVLLSLQ